MYWTQDILARFSSLNRVSGRPRRRSSRSLGIGALVGHREPLSVARECPPVTQRMGSAVCFSQGLHGLFGGPQQLLASRVVCFSRVRRAGPMLLFASWPDASNQCFLPRSFRWPSPVAQGSWFQSPVLYIEKRERRPPLLAGGCFFVTMTSNLLAALKSNQGKTSTTAVYPLIEAAKSGQVEGCSKVWIGPGLLFGNSCGLKPMGSHFGVGASPILEPILVGIGMFTGDTGL